jgi:hypothetical protein
MPKGPQGQRRPADVIVAAIMASRMATGEMEEPAKPADGTDKASVAMGKKGGVAQAATRLGRAACATAIVILGCGFSFGSACAQLSGDFRNTTLNIGKGMSGDVPLNVQNDGQGQPQATGGVTVKEGDKVSFDAHGSLATKTAGFWKGTNGKTYRIALNAPRSSTTAQQQVVALIEIDGTVRWNAERNVVEGQDSLRAIATANDHFLPIAKREIKGGTLFVSAADGVRYKIYGLSSDFTATVEKVAGADKSVSPSKDLNSAKP